MSGGLCVLIPLSLKAASENSQMTLSCVNVGWVFFSFFLLPSFVEMTNPHFHDTALGMWEFPRHMLCNFSLFWFILLSFFSPLLLQIQFTGGKIRKDPNSVLHFIGA